MVVSPQTLIDELLALILVGLNKNRLEEGHPLINGFCRCVFRSFTIGRNRRHTHQEVPYQILLIRKHPASAQVNRVPELMVGLDEMVLVIHLEVTPEDPLRALLISGLYEKANMDAVLRAGWGRDCGDPPSLPSEAGAREGSGV